MACDTSRFTITKGLDNTFVFTIKANGSTLPMEIVEGTDTFTASLVKLSDNTTVLTQDLVVTDAVNGQVSLVFLATAITSLLSEKGSKADRYYLRPTYKLIIDCSTVNNGDFIAKVPEVYVD